MLISPDEPFPILTFCALNPGIAFLLSWPLMLCIIAASWFGAQVLSTTVTLLSNSFVQLLNAVIIVLRGYPAPSVVNNGVAPDSDNTDSRD